MPGTDFGLLLARGFNAYVGYLHEPPRRRGSPTCGRRSACPARAARAACTLTELARSSA